MNNQSSNRFAPGTRVRHIINNVELTVVATVETDRAADIVIVEDDFGVLGLEHCGLLEEISE